MDATKLGIVGAVLALLSGCANVPSTARRAVLMGAGSAAGGATAYSVSGKSKGWGVAGAGLGAAATALALGSDKEVRQEGFDDGYVQGQSDSIKRQYFLRQALEAAPLPGDSEEGKAVHYLVPGPQVTADGRKLEPHTVTLTVTE